MRTLGRARRAGALASHVVLRDCFLTRELCCVDPDRSRAQTAAKLCRLRKTIIKKSDHYALLCKSKVLVSCVLL